jgi:PAS domain S-box-containing protein
MFYNKLAESADNLVYRINEAGNFVYVNQTVMRITGYSMDELIGTHFSKLLREDYKDFAINFYRQQFEQKSQAAYLELPLIKKNGHVIWLGQNVCIETNGGDIQIAAIAHEIKDKPKTGNKFFNNAEWHTELVEKLQDGILVEDNNRKIITANKTFCNMFNILFTPEELAGKSYWHISESLKKSVKDPDKFELAEEHLITERTYLIAELIELANGNAYERDRIPIYNERGCIGSVWKYRDITEKTAIKKELLKNERKYKSIIDTMKLGLLEVNNDGYIISANESFCEMLAYDSIDELIGKEAFTTLLDDESKEIMRTQMALREQGASGAYEIKIKKANGMDTAWVLISGTPLFDDNNNVVGSIGIHLDITPQKIIAKELDEARARESYVEAQEKAMELLEEKVAERIIEVVTAKKFIENKNNEITMSLNYALRIQKAVLPDKNQIRKSLPESFILFKPKDIVSGDFYFYNKNNDRIIIAAADCTGHGVPGAFMSLLGSEKLLMAVQNELTPGATLSFLDRSIKNSLHHSESEKSILDGMDIALCSLDLKNKIIQFAGARRPIWIFRNKENILEEIKGTKKDIGGWNLETQMFETHEIQLKNDDTFYLFSDGFADQFGENNKRLMTKRFKEQLLSIQHLSLPEQKIALKNFFDTWKGSREQTDDVLVIGVRL